MTIVTSSDASDDGNTPLVTETKRGEIHQGRSVPLLSPSSPLPPPPDHPREQRCIIIISADAPRPAENSCSAAADPYAASLDRTRVLVRPRG